MRMGILALLVVLGAHLQLAEGAPCRLANAIADCAFKSLHAVPELPHYITHLYIGANYIQEVNHTSFSGLEGLQEVDLEGQQVNGLVIRNNTFRQLRNLTRLYLGHNIRLRLELDAFVGLSSLRLLSMFVCRLSESILEASYLQPLVSLEILDLFGNEIKRIRPAPFFASMLELKELNLRLNRIGRICESDLVSFQGRRFRQLQLDSVHLYDMTQYGFDWDRCGNPFRNMSIETLDLSSNGFNVDKVKLFSKAIEGSKIRHLLLKGSHGKGFSFSNFKDPDMRTYEGLKSSGIKTFDLSKSFIFALKFSVFSPLREVEEITLADNTINQIDRGAFSGLEHLRTLNLSRNLLGTIQVFTFENLPSLQVLDLSYNHIGAFEYKAFKGLSGLVGLDLRGNSIRKLGTLTPLPNLYILRLDDNRITSTSINDLVSFAKNSHILNVQNNRLNNLEDVYTILASFRNLQSLLYGGNFIMWCSINGNTSVPLLNSLKVLDLDRSSLQTIWAQGSCLGLFDNLSQLGHLFLGHNSLLSLPAGIFKGLASVEYLDLSFNSLTYLQPDVLPESLRSLDLSNNYLAHPDPLAFRSLSHINLRENRFHCDCKLMDFLSWLNHTNVTFGGPVEELSCEFPPDFRGTGLLRLNAEGCEEDDERLVQELRLSLFACCSALVILTTAAFVAFARLRGVVFAAYKKAIGRIVEGRPRGVPAPGGEALRYDAFLCFSDNDYRWAETALLERLDSQFAERNVLRCCFEARDFLPGENHLANIREAVWSSGKTVCVVSQAFLRDGWCLEAFTLAQSRALEELRDVLIVVVVGKVPHYRLMKHEAIRTFVQKREYLNWPEDDQDVEWFYERLTSKILKDRKVKNKDKAEDNNLDIPLENIGAARV